MALIGDPEKETLIQENASNLEFDCVISSGISEFVVMHSWQHLASLKLYTLVPSFRKGLSCLDALEMRLQTILKLGKII